MRPILEDVRKRGDKALLEYARKFDELRPQVAARDSATNSTSRCGELTPEFRKAVETASKNIRALRASCRCRRPKSAAVAPGLRVGQIVRPLDTVAAYIPAGRYPLPSTLMMTVIPAQVAGVPNVCVTSPRPVPEILGTASPARCRTTFS